MRTLALYALLCIRCGAAVWFQDASHAGGPPGAVTCSAHCAQKTERRESRSCPYAKFIEGKYYYWQKYRGCKVQDLMIETTCGDTRNGGLKAQIKKIFGGKHTVMIGDSTMKQTYIGLLCMIWEEGLVDDVFRDVEHRAFVRIQPDPEKEDHGYINAYMPELGDGTNFTYVRKDSGVPGPLMMSVLDTADITVANLAMHYCITGMTNNRCNTEHRYEVEMPLMLSNISKRGRPGHRAFWRDALVCPDYDSNPDPKTYSGYGCVAEANPALRMHNSLIAIFPEFKEVEKIPVAELYMPFWWAHPGGHDCCHMVSQMPGLLSATSRVLLAMLSKPAGSPVQVGRTDSKGTAQCPKMKTNCLAERVDLWPM